MNQFKSFGIKPIISTFTGDKIKIDRILNTEIQVLSYKIEASKVKTDTKLLTLQIQRGETKNIIFTGSNVLMQMIESVPKDKFPFTTKIVKDSEHLEFT